MTEYFTKDGDEFKPVDENLFSQHEIDTNIIPKRLERERGKYADYDDLKDKASKVDTITTEYEDKLTALGTEKSDLEGKLKSATLETEKVKIVHEFKLSTDLEEFVVGDTADEMRKRAEKLANGIKGDKVIINKGEKPKGKDTDSKKIAKGLFSNGSD